MLQTMTSIKIEILLKLNNSMLLHNVQFTGQWIYKTMKIGNKIGSYYKTILLNEYIVMCQNDVTYSIAFINVRHLRIFRQMFINYSAKKDFEQ